MVIERIIQEESKFLEAVECDGASRIFHYKLSEYQIAHRCYAGSLHLNDKVCIRAHVWIELSDGRIIDYKAKMWAGPAAPHGIFHPDSFPGYTYAGKEITLNVTENLYNALREEKSVAEWRKELEKIALEKSAFRSS